MPPSEDTPQQELEWAVVQPPPARLTLSIARGSLLGQLGFYAILFAGAWLSAQFSEASCYWGNVLLSYLLPVYFLASLGFFAITLFRWLVSVLGGQRVRGLALALATSGLALCVAACGAFGSVLGSATHLDSARIDGKVYYLDGYVAFDSDGTLTLRECDAIGAYCLRVQYISFSPSLPGAWDAHLVTDALGHRALVQGANGLLSSYSTRATASHDTPVWVHQSPQSE